MFKYLFLFLLSFSACADEWTQSDSDAAAREALSITHPNDWTTADTTREAVYMVFHVADWAQTRNISRHKDECKSAPSTWGQPWCEQNPILGKYPSLQRVNAYFLLTGAAHYLIARELPAKYRSAFQYITIGMEANQVHMNLKLGIGVEF